MGLNAKQTEQLLRGINPKRVLELRGQSHLAAWDVEAHLTRVFGFEGWDKRIRSIELVFEDGVKRGTSDRVGWYVTYRCLMTLIIKDPRGNIVKEIDDGATGSAENQPSRGEAHDLAYKSAIAYALKRCAKDLGDQFGLSLYNDGSRKPTIIAVLSAEQDDVETAIPDEVHPDSDAAGGPEAQDTQPAAPEPGNDAEAAAVTAETSRPVARQAAADDPVFGDWAPKIEAIASQEDAKSALVELDRAHRGGVIDSRRAAMIRGAIKDKVTLLVGNGHAPRPQRPRGPSAEERGAKPVPTGSGDNGEWAQHFEERVRIAAEGDLAGLQQQVGNAVRAKKITPGKAADLSKAIQAKRAELQGAAA